MNLHVRRITDIKRKNTKKKYFDSKMNKIKTLLPKNTFLEP
jgi:hypothetical protein